MKNLTHLSIQGVGLCLLNSCLLTIGSIEAQQVTPNRSLKGSSLQQNRTYQEGQAVFVQPPYGSSVYTEYRYNPAPQDSNRLPSYTTNQSVFVQQPYGLTSETKVIPFPTTNQNALPNNPNRYATPVDFPSTTSPAYPFGTADYSATSPYPTTVQLPSANPTQVNPTYTRTDTYPYTSVQPSPQLKVPQTNTTSYYNPYGSNGTYPVNSYPQIVNPNQGSYPSNYPPSGAAPSNYPSIAPQASYSY